MAKHARAQLAIRIIQPGLHHKVAGISISWLSVALVVNPRGHGERVRICNIA